MVGARKLQGARKRRGTRKRQGARKRQKVSEACGARKRLGQNFLCDANISAKIARLAHRLAPHGVCDEIGAGSGNLTAALLAENFRVTAIEKDTLLLPVLAARFPNATLQLVHSDVLDWQPPLTDTARLCVGNIPYVLTTGILLWLKKYRNSYQHALFTVQREVAERLVAQPASKAYGRITACMQLFFEVRKHFNIPRSCFRPQPRVDSALISLTPHTSPCNNAEQELAFERFTHLLFHMRRKTLATTLRRHGISCHALTATERQARVETLSPLRIWALMCALSPDTSTD